MRKKLTEAVAVKTFLSEGSENPPTTQDFMSFWRSLTPEEKTEFAAHAAQHLDVEIETK